MTLLSTQVRKAVQARDQKICQHCGKSSQGRFYSAVDIHHIKPRALNGSDELANLITLCRSCHQAAEAKNRIKSFYEETDILHQINSLAEAEGLTQTDIVRRAIRQYLERPAP